MSFLSALKRQDIHRTVELLAMSIRLGQNQTKRQYMFNAEFFAKEVVYYYIESGNAFDVNQVTDLFQAIGGAVSVLYNLNANEAKHLWEIHASQSWKTFCDALEREKFIYRDKVWNEIQKATYGALFLLIHGSFGINEQDVVGMENFQASINQLKLWGVEIPHFAMELVNEDMTVRRNTPLDGNDEWYAKIATLIADSDIDQLLHVIQGTPFLRFQLYKVVSDIPMEGKTMAQETQIIECIEKIATAHEEKHVLFKYPGIFILAKKKKLHGICNEVRVRLDLETAGYPCLPELYECYTDVIDRFFQASRASLNNQPEIWGIMCEAFVKVLCLELSTEAASFRLAVSTRFGLNWSINPSPAEISAPQLPVTSKQYSSVYSATPSCQLIDKAEMLPFVANHITQSNRIAIKVQNDGKNLTIFACETSGSREVFILDAGALNQEDVGAVMSKLFQSLNNKIKIIGLDTNKIVSTLRSTIPKFPNIGFKMTDLAKVVNSFHYGYETKNLLRMIQQILGKHLDTRALYSDWNRRPLRKVQLECEARAATVLFDLYDALVYPMAV